MFADDPYLEGIFNDLLKAKVQVDEEQRRLSELKQVIQQRMGDATKAVFNGGSVTWKRTRDSARFDAERFAGEHPELFSRYSVAKSGSRRFVINDKP